MIERSGVTSPALMWLIANRKVYCDLENERLFDSDEVWVHESEEAALAHRYLSKSSDCEDEPGWPFHHEVRPVVLDPGREVLFRDVHCEVVNRSADAVTLRSTLELQGEFRIFSVGLGDVRKLLRTGDLRAASSIGEESRAEARQKAFIGASRAQLSQALRWWNHLEYYAKHRKVPPGSTLRTIQRHQEWVRQAQRRLGAGFLGLFRPKGRSPGTIGLPEPQRAALAEAVAEFQGKGNPVARRPSRREASAYSLFVVKCLELGIDSDEIISERTFRRHVRAGSASAAETRRRGARAGYQFRGPRLHPGASLPRHGDRVWEIGHIDSTLLDIILVPDYPRI